MESQRTKGSAPWLNCRWLWIVHSMKSHHHHHISCSYLVFGQQQQHGANQSNCECQEGIDNHRSLKDRQHAGDQLWWNLSQRTKGSAPWLTCAWLLWIVKGPVLSLPSKLLMEGSKKRVCQNHLCLLDTSSSLMISLPLVSPSVQFSVLLRVQTSPYQIHTRGAIFLKGVHEPLFLSLPPPLLSPIVFKPLDPCMSHSL